MTSKAAAVYRVLFVVDCVAALVAVAFFLIGLADGSISSFNLGLWFGLLALIAALVLGARALHRHGRTWLANGLLAVLAAPCAVYVVFIVAILMLQPRWN